MYISELNIENFRAFGKKTTIHFNEGINVIIGPNNAGKTAIIKSLGLLFNSRSSKRLLISDFNREQTDLETLFNQPPKITISAKLTESKEKRESEENYSDELITVATWLTKIESPYEAMITFEFFLPEVELDHYKEYWTNQYEAIDDINIYWKEFEYTFLRKYISKVYVGNPEFKNSVQSEDIARFDFQFLDAIRDVERDLYRGNNSLLREVIDFFMDYNIKESEELSEKEKGKAIANEKTKFSRQANILISELQERMKDGEEEILKYVSKTGAGIDESVPTLDGTIADTELYSALRLIVEKESGIKLPATSNGLGYNNLIYISILLSKMQRDSSAKHLGLNSKVFSLLSIEEPEAHLHPNMQYKFLKFLKENQETDVDQLFITSHSPNITAAVDIDDIIVVQKANGVTKVAYPGKVFNEKDSEDVKSKRYVKRFLDVTKADIFFAESLIFVEGISEQLVIPAFASNMDKDLFDTHTSIINLGGRYFDHFLKLFDTKKSSFAISKKVACVTDLDPERRVLKPDLKEKNSRQFTACEPIFYGLEPEKYEYRAYSNKTIDNSIFEAGAPIRLFTQEKERSSTFEHDLLLKNAPNKALITESVANSKELNTLMDLLEAGENLEVMIKKINKCKFKDEVEESVSLLTNEEDTKKSLIASRYLMSIGKGEVAQELARVIEEGDIEPPNYIKEAIEWISSEGKN